jgi:predicted DsbA family dithiol-disulfide isomerase
MADSIRFVFDPICPWCWQTSRWVRQLVRLGEVEASWGLFSLELVNAGNADTAAKGHARSAPSLRTAVTVRSSAGEEAVGRFYEALGERVHGRDEPLEEHATITGALTDAGLEEALLEKALADDGTWTTVVTEHTELCERTRSFGVPTIVLDGGDGPAIFGPVITEPPTNDDDAVQLWRHVSWLTRYENFSELKRDRVTSPDLESVRQWQARRAQQQES